MNNNSKYYYFTRYYASNQGLNSPTYTNIIIHVDETDTEWVIPNDGSIVYYYRPDNNSCIEQNLATQDSAYVYFDPSKVRVVDEQEFETANLVVDTPSW